MFTGGTHIELMEDDDSFVYESDEEPAAKLEEPVVVEAPVKVSIEVSPDLRHSESDDPIHRAATQSNPTSEVLLQSTLAAEQPTTHPSSHKSDRKVPELTPNTVDPNTYDLKKMLGKAPLEEDLQVQKMRPGSVPVHAENRIQTRPPKTSVVIQETYSFAPTTNRKGGEELRSQKDFYESQLAFQEAVQTKTTKLKEKYEKLAQDQTPFKPVISAKSVEIAEQREKAEPLHDRLMHQRAFERTLPKDYHEEAGLFSIPEKPPHVRNPPKTAQHPRTEKPVSRKLSPDVVQPREEIKASEQSQKLLERKFKTEYQLQWSETGATTEVRYYQYLDILGGLSLVSNDQSTLEFSEHRTLAHKLWNLVVPSDSGLAAKQHLLVLLLAVMDYYNPSVPATTGSWSGIGSIQEDKLYLSEAETEKLRKDFSALREHRCNLFNKKPSSIIPEKFSFRPRVTNKTKRIFEMLKMGREHTSPHDFLYQDAFSKEEREKVRKKNTDNENVLKECTFMPQVNGRSEKLIGKIKTYKNDSLSVDYIKLATAEEKTGRTDLLYSLSTFSKARKEKAAKTRAVVEEEKNMVNCTFRPMVNINTVQSTTAAPKGSEKAIERLQKARERLEWEKAHRAQGTPYQGEKRKANSNPRAKNIEFSPVFREVKAVVSVELEVKSQAGKAGVLRYREGENVETVVQAFGHELGKCYTDLNAQEIDSLKVMLRKQLTKQVK